MKTFLDDLKKEINNMMNYYKNDDLKGFFKVLFEPFFAKKPAIRTSSIGAAVNAEYPRHQPIKTEYLSNVSSNNTLNNENIHIIGNDVTEIKPAEACLPSDYSSIKDLPEGKDLTIIRQPKATNSENNAFAQQDSSAPPHKV